MDGLADDRDVARLDRERVERRVHRALERVLDRDERALDVAAVDGHDGVVDGRRTDGVERIRPGGEQRLLAEGPRRAEERDLHANRMFAQANRTLALNAALPAPRRPAPASSPRSPRGRARARPARRARAW